MAEDVKSYFGTDVDNKLDAFGQNTKFGKLLGGGSGIKSGLNSIVDAGIGLLNNSANKGLGLTSGQAATKNTISNIAGKFGLAGKAFQLGTAAMD